jgi:hypothetical protein
MLLSAGSYDRRCNMAMAVQPMPPVAHLPLVLGVLRRLEVATVSAPTASHLTRRMGSRVGVGSTPWSWPSWMAIMPSTKGENGWKNGA